MYPALQIGWCHMNTGKIDIVTHTIHLAHMNGARKKQLFPQAEILRDDVKAKSNTILR